MDAKYRALTWLSFMQGVKNYKALIGLSVFMITCLIIFAHIWKVAALKVGSLDFPPDRLLWYIASNEWILVALPDIFLDMEHELRSGKLAYLLPRPISYLGAKFAEGLGTLLINLLVLGTVAFTFAWFWTGSFPFTPLSFLVLIAISVLAGMVALLFLIATGLSAFWLQEVGPFYWIWEKMMFVLGGLMIPLAAYPSYIQTIASWTPFPAILGARSALALDFNLETVAWLFFQLTLWGLGGTLLVRILYVKGLRILNIEGG